MKKIQLTILALLCITSLFTKAVYAIDVNVDFKDIDSEDVDILVGEFSSLVKAFEKFAVSKNSILELRINQVFSKFDDSMTCAIDQLMVKSKNAIEGGLPSFGVFREQESKACESATLKKFGTGGTLDRVIYEQCVLTEYIRNKPVSFQSVSSGYSGLKEIANAAYCQFKRNHGTEEYRYSKEIYSKAAILVSAYADISRLNGCKISDPSTLHQCTIKYYSQQISTLKSFNKNDLEHVNFDSLSVQLKGITPPQSHKRMIFWEDKVLLPDQLNKYEELISELRRNVELADLSKRRRAQMYTKMIPENKDKIRSISSHLNSSNKDLEKQHIKCGKWSAGYCYSLDWGSFNNYVAPLDGAISACSSLVTDKRYDDLVTSDDKKVCVSVANTARARIREIISYFKKRNNDQARSAMDQRMVDGAPK